MVKRSPILGYNHNVRYRGLVFHVQTEDSGVLSPHLFTHLFHHGVIVSTRKLVYDSGSAEDAIKALMQAQHKAVLKDLKRGQFDDKIDQYLGGTPGLIPRGATDEGGEADADRSSQVAITPPSQPVVEEVIDLPSAGVRTDAEIALGREPTIAMGRELTLEEPALGLRPTEEVAPHQAAELEAPEAPVTPRTVTAERTSGPSKVLTSLPVGDELEPDAGDSLGGQTVRVDSLADFLGQSSPGIQLGDDVVDELDELVDDEDGDEDAPGGRRRRARDTDIAPLDDYTRPTLDIPASDGIPGSLPVQPTLRTPNDVPPPPVPTPPVTARLGQSTRASTAVGAATLPPARPITRPPSRQSIVPPQVVSRILPSEDRRAQGDGAVEVYAPAPPSVELPPHANAPERPGQYSQHKKISTRIQADPPREAARLHPQQGSVPTSSGPPVRQSSSALPVVPPPRVPTASPAPAGKSGSIPTLVVPSASSGPTTRPGGPPPPPPPMRAGSHSAIPVPGGSGRTPPPLPPVRHTPTPLSVPVVRPGEPGSAALADTTKTSTSRPSAPTPHSGVPAAAVGNAPTAPASSPVPVAQAGSGAATTPSQVQTRPVGSQGGGVVMTRPAVIVGAPGRPTPPPTQRIRKAREDEGARGFGQGLISEKSLDEVILAYLSEDGEDK